MSHDNESALRDQLIEARTTITAQLGELRGRSVSGLNSVQHLPPNYASLITELEQQLTEIKALLDQ